MSKRGDKKLKVKVNKTAPVKPTEPVRIEFDEEKTEREKRLFMRVGVSCVMAVIFIIWIFNLKYQFAANTDKTGRNDFNWDQTRAELDRAMAQVKQGITEIKNIRESAAQTEASTQAGLTPEQIKLLEGKLINEISTSTASSTKQ